MERGNKDKGAREKERLRRERFLTLKNLRHVLNGAL